MRAITEARSMPKRYGNFLPNSSKPNWKNLLCTSSAAAISSVGCPPDFAACAMTGMATNAAKARAYASPRPRPSRARGTIGVAGIGSESDGIGVFLEGAKILFEVIHPNGVREQGEPDAILAHLLRLDPEPPQDLHGGRRDSDAIALKLD